MLKGNRINLRLMRETDLDAYVRLSQNVEARGDFFPLDLSSESAIRERYRTTGFWSDEFRTMVIAEASTDEILGTVFAFKPVSYQDSLELGYILHDVTRRGEGLMTEAVLLFCDYLFRLKNIYRIQVQVETGNIASRRTAEKAGFKHEGTLRQCLITRCEPSDMEMYSILRTELPARPK